MIANRFYPLGVNHRPYDAEVEWLQTDGEAYVNTGVYGSNNTRIVASVKTVSASGYNAIFGAREAFNSYRLDCIFEANGTSGWCGFGNGDENVAIFTGIKTGDNIFDIDRGSLSVNGAYIASAPANTFTTKRTIKLFCNDTNGICSQFFVGRIYRLKIYDNCVIVRDFIPVRVGDVGYMYDRVSGKLFGNQSTGQFILGADK